MILANVVVSDELANVIKETLSLCYKIIGGLMTAFFTLIWFMYNQGVKRFEKINESSGEITQKNTDAINSLKETAIMMSMQLKESDALHSQHIADKKEQKKILELHTKQIDKINYKLGIEYEQ